MRPQRHGAAGARGPGLGLGLGLGLPLRLPLRGARYTAARSTAATGVAARMAPPRNAKSRTLAHQSWDVARVVIRAYGNVCVAYVTCLVTGT